MKTFLKPFWWIPVFLIPQVLLFLYELSIYSIVKTEASVNLSAWKTMAGIQLSIFLISLAYISYRFIQKKNIHFTFPIFLLVLMITFLSWFFSHLSQLVPFSIPNWMVNQDEFSLLFFVFAMPVIFFSVLQLVSYTIPEHRNPKQLITSIGSTLVIPLGWYLFFTFSPSLYRIENMDLRKTIEHMFVILGIISVVLFFFFLIRTLLLVSENLLRKPLARTIIVLVCCLIAPLTGLIFNNMGIPIGDKNIFGDFSHWAFYALAILNGILLLLPSFKERRLERILVALRFFTLPFSFYFLIVFLPFLPLSIIAMVMAGAGILLLAPVVNFIVHVYRLSEDLRRNEFFPNVSRQWLVATPVLLLPALIHFNYLIDRQDLHQALAWIYTPQYDQRKTDVNPERISHILEVIAHNGRSRGPLNGKKYYKPYLTSYYRWLVLDNLTLSGQKISDLERIFTGNRFYTFSGNFRENPSSDVLIESLETETTQDPDGNFYKTTIHLRLKNQSDQQQEFIRRFKLPEGAWISNYYLDIADERAYGILAEKRTAQWVYRNIVNRRKDPGIVSYVRGNELELKVFPMEAKEERKTGLEILHTGPLHFSLGESEVRVEKPSLSISPDNHVRLVTEEEKNRTPSIVRKKKYFLLIDNSTSLKSTEAKTLLLKRVEAELKTFTDSAHQLVELHSVNHCAHDLGLKAWRAMAERHTPEGGFFPDRLMKSILTDHYYHAPDLAPVFLLYTPTFPEMNTSFMDLSFTFPDVDRFFVSTDQGTFSVLYRDVTTTAPPSGSPETMSPAMLALGYKPLNISRWSDAAGQPFNLPATGPSFVVSEGAFVPLQAEDPLWKKAAIQEANVRFLQLHPEVSEKYWRQLVAQNFETGILSPYTSYLVVETEAQKEVLKQKQKEVLNAAQYFDLEQEFISMAEPAWWWYVLIPALLLWSYRKKIQTA